MMTILSYNGCHGNYSCVFLSSVLTQRTHTNASRCHQLHTLSEVPITFLSAVAE